MKKILIIRTNKVDPDPRVEKEATVLCKNKNFDVSVLAWDRDAKHPCIKEQLRLPNKTIPIYRFGIPAQWGNGMKSNIKSALIYEYKLFFWLLKHIKEYDYIHACDLMTGLPAILPAKLLKKKIVYDCCDYYADTQHGPQFIMQILRNMETCVINHADATILCSEKRIQQIAPAKPKSVTYIHNSPDMSAFQIKPNKPRICKSNSTRLKLVYVGNFCQDRWLLELLQNVSQMSYKVEFHIGGYGGLESKINEYAKNYENIFMYGKLEYQDVLQLESECDCLTALYETHIPNHIYAAPNKFYEALALGKPLLMLKGSGMSEIIDKEKIGAVIEPTFNSLSEGIDKIKKLLINNKEMKAKMKHIFQTQYAWDIMEERLNKLYKEIIETNEN